MKFHRNSEKQWNPYNNQPNAEARKGQIKSYRKPDILICMVPPCKEINCKPITEEKRNGKDKKNWKIMCTWRIIC